MVKKKSHAQLNIALLYCSFGLCLRAKEMAALKIKRVLGIDGNLLDEINLSGAMTKGNKQRHAYLTNLKVVGAIMDFIEDRQKGDGIPLNVEAPLFRSQKSSSFSPNSFQQLFHRMCIYQEAKIQGASSHSGRRTFATTLIEKGVDIKAVSTLMGHSSIVMTAQYVEDNPMRLKQICIGVL